MPPRYAYWTIIVDNQPTAFRSSTQEELLPTFKRIKAKSDSAVMMWFQNGKLWPSREDAQELMRARGEMGRRADERQMANPRLREGGAGGGFRDRERKPFRERNDREGARSAWTPRGEPSTPAPVRNADDKLDWKPKGEFVPAPKRADRAERSERPDWKTKRPESSERPEWKPKGSFDQESSPSTYSKAPADRQARTPSTGEKPEWKPKGSFDRESKPEWKSKNSYGDRDRKSEWTPKPSSGERPEWKPKGSFDRESKPDWKSKSPRSSAPSHARTSGSEKPEWKPKGSFDREAKPEWKSKSSYGDRDRKPGWHSERSSPSTYAKAPSDKPAFRPSTGEKPEWKPKGSFDRESKPDWKSKSPRSSAPSHARTSDEKPEWKPRGSFDRESKPAWKPKSSYGDRDRKPAWTPKSSEKPEWKPKGSFDRERKPDWDSKASSPQARKPWATSRPQSSERPEWKPRGEGSSSSRTPGFTPTGEKRKWMPKEEYKKSMGIEAKRDSKWRPGGEHKDPRQKYIDAKKAKWTKFKKNIRARSGGKGKKSS